MPHSSFRPHADTAYHADLGPPTAVADAWLAGPADVRLQLNIQIVEADLLLRDAYVRMSVAEDGTMAGVLQGYWSSESLVEVLASTDAHLGALGYSLEEFQAVLDAHADRSPGEDGVCTALSAAFAFTGVPAFVLAEEATP